MCEMLNARGVTEVLGGISESKAYELIRQMNSELAARGFLTIRGKIPRSYLEKRFFGFSESLEGQ